MNREVVHPHDEEEDVRPSLARSSTARLAALASILVFGFVTSVATARWLGPSGKGTLSALSFLGDVFFFYICLMGVGEAAIVLIGKKQIDLQGALSATLIPLVATGAIGIASLLVISVPADWAAIIDAVLIEGMVLALALYMSFFQDLLNARERFGTTSAVTIVRVFVTAATTLLFLGVVGLEIEGAVLASLCGVVVGVGGLARALRRSGLSFRPRWDPAYLRRAIKLGVVMQGAYLLMAMSQRVDQLLVYSFLDPVDGGRYAVALTLGLLPGYVPVAITQATFPRLAHIEEEDVWPLTAQTIRVGLIGGALTAVTLAATLPYLVPEVFGNSYGPSVRPAWILMAGALIWSVQWTLARAWAARGRPSLLLTSFLVTVVMMIVLDLVLMRTMGMVGAAIASVVASSGGLAVCLFRYRKRSDSFDARLLIPGVADLRLLLAHGRDLVTGG